MKGISFVIKVEFPISAGEMYQAWLNSEIHSAMTGAKAVCSEKPGAKFSAWDGYISGENQFLIPDQEIIQSWRTSDFKPGDHDSEIIIRLKNLKKGCVLELTHHHIPADQPDYKQGWKEHYFKPMREYFKQR